MTLSILTLTAGFVFVCVLLLSLSLKTAFHWSIKAGLIAIALGFYLVTLKTLPGFYGWPTAEPLPDNFILISHQAIEPENETDKGAIYIWVEDLSLDDKKPRAYVQDYSPELHSRLQAAQKRMDFGQTMAGAMPSEGKSDGNVLPTFQFIEKPRPPAKN